jgi:outer membrane receptor protein involved in Fe transport
VFHEEWDDIQYGYLPPGGVGLTVIRNVGAAEIDGVEADLAWAPMDSLTVSGGFTWLDAALTKDYIEDPKTPLASRRPSACDAGVQGQRRAGATSRSATSRTRAGGGRLHWRQLPDLTRRIGRLWACRTITRSTWRSA